jgi:hypothetical protein
LDCGGPTGCASIDDDAGQTEFFGDAQNSVDMVYGFAE